MKQRGWNEECEECRLLTFSLETKHAKSNVGEAVGVVCQRYHHVAGIAHDTYILRLLHQFVGRGQLTVG